MTHCASLGWDPRAVAFSNGPLGPNGSYHLAVGSVKGQIKVRDSTQRLSASEPGDVCFSPAGHQIVPRANATPAAPPVLPTDRSIWLTPCNDCADERS